MTDSPRMTAEQTPNPMIGRVMLAIKDNEGAPPETVARAAMAAMLNPTKAMCAAAKSALRLQKITTRLPHESKHKIRYRAMIHAALTGEAG